VADLFVFQFAPAPPLLDLQWGAADGTTLPAILPTDPLPTIPVIVGPSGAARSYVQTFASASLEWVVNHNLGIRPTSVTVTTAGGVEMFAQVLHVNTNQCRILFASPQAGIVRCS
jgi:hypothetical protein